MDSAVISHPGVKRIFVLVNAEMDRAGRVRPLAILWEDGRRFPIESIISCRYAADRARGEEGDCYTVLIRGEKRHLYFKRTPDTIGSALGRWWVEIPSA